MTTLEKKIIEARDEKYPAELALGFVRYEKLRTLRPAQFARIDALAMSGDARFDDLIDRLINGEQL